jgi:hypothetical protein
MSRDSAGTYTLPAGNPVVTSTVIASSWANTTLSDLATAMTDSLSRSGLGGMTAAFKIADGTAGAPGLSFTTEPTSGLYKISAGVFGYSISTTLRLQIDATGITVTGAVVSSGAMTATAHIVTGATVPANGLYLPAANTVGIAAAGTLRYSVNSTGNHVFAAPSSGVALVVAAAAGLRGVQVNGTAGSNALFQTSDNGTAKFSFGWVGGASQFQIFDDVAGVPRLSLGTAGNVTINAPSSGNTAVLNTIQQTLPSNTSGVLVASTSKAIRMTNTAAGSYIEGTDQTGASSFQPLVVGGSTLEFQVSAVASILVSTNRNVTINSPSNGVTTTINANPNTGEALRVVGNSTNNVAAQFLSNAGAHSILMRPDTGSVNMVTSDFITGSVFIPLGLSGRSNSADLRLGILGGVSIGITGTATPGLTCTGSAATPVNAIGNSSTAFTLDCTRSNVHTVTMTGNVAGGSFTISNPQDGQTVNVFLTQDATGSRTLGYPAAVKWPGGTAGVLSTAANSVDLLVMTYRSVTGFWYATLTKAFA